MRVQNQPRGRYSVEFKTHALKLLHTSRGPLTAIAAQLGISHWTLRDWYRADVSKKKAKDPISVAPVDLSNESDEQRLSRLERENRELRKKVGELEMDKAILKKAAAFFAKESG